MASTPLLARQDAPECARFRASRNLPTSACSRRNRPSSITTRRARSMARTGICFCRRRLTRPARARLIGCVSTRTSPRRSLGDLSFATSRILCLRRITTRSPRGRRAVASSGWPFGMKTGANSWPSSRRSLNFRSTLRTVAIAPIVGGPKWPRSAPTPPSASWLRLSLSKSPCSVSMWTLSASASLPTSVCMCASTDPSSPSAGNSCSSP